MNRRQLFVVVLAPLPLLLGAGCTSLPDPKIHKYQFPKEAFIGEPPKKPYQSLGVVRTKVNYPTLTEKYEESSLCENYFNKAAHNLVREAKKKGGDAVIDVKSIVFMLDGRSASYPKAECVDDGAEGQVLAQGTAIKWEPVKREGD